MHTKYNKLNTFKISAFVLLLGFIIANLGCIERKYVIITSPADCEIYLDGKYVGNTVVRIPNDPDAGMLETPIDHYAESEIVAKKKDCESRTELIKPDTPWFEFFPIDFFSEVLIPYTIKVRFEYRLDLDKYEDMNSDDLFEKAEDMRDYSSEKLKNSDENTQ